MPTNRGGTGLRGVNRQHTPRGRLADFVKQVAAESRKLAELGAPPDIRETVMRVKFEQESARYTRDVLTPTRQAAIAAAKRLERALSAWLKAEQQRPIDPRVRFQEAISQSQPDKRLPNKPSTERIGKDAHMRAMFAMAEPALILKFMPYLLAHLGAYGTQRDAGRVGRPRSIARAVQDAIAGHGIGDRRAAHLLSILEIEGKSDIGRATARARERRRARQRTGE